MWKSRIFFLIGCWVLLFSGLQLIPLLFALMSQDDLAVGGLTISLVVSALVGGSLFLGFRSAEKIRISRLTIFLPLVGTPVLAIVAGLPLFILFPDHGFMAAFFDGMSQITTNGSSAFDDRIASIPSLILWRAITSWLGGLVAISFSLSLLMALNSGGLQLHRSPLYFGERETGYQRLSSITSSVLPIYAGLTSFCWLFLVISGSNSFQALVLSLSAISTSGGVPEAMLTGQSSLGRIVLIIFLLVGMSNWDFHHLRYRKRSFAIKQDRELRFTLLTAFSASVILMVLNTQDSFAILDPIFASVSALSTFGAIPESMRSSNGELPLAILLMCLAAVGGTVASTSGGLKQMRVFLIFRMGKAEIDRLGHPNGIHTVRYGKATAEPRDIEAIWLLLGAFIFTMALGATALAILGLSFQEALALAFASMTLSGPIAFAADPAFPGYDSLNQADYFILSCLLVVGRLEASLCMALFAKALWRG